MLLLGRFVVQDSRVKTNSRMLRLPKMQINCKYLWIVLYSSNVKTFHYSFFLNKTTNFPDWENCREHLSRCLLTMTSSSQLFTSFHSSVLISTWKGTSKQQHLEMSSSILLQSRSTSNVRSQSLKIGLRGKSRLKQEEEEEKPGKNKKKNGENRKKTDKNWIIPSTVQVE